MALTWAYRIGGTGTTLTAAQRDNNILCIYGAMSRYGFSTAAIAGMCGCFFAESGFNPGIYETSHGGNLNNLPSFHGGMGLAQWTDYPAYSGTYPNPLPWSADQERRIGHIQQWATDRGRAGVGNKAAHILVLALINTKLSAEPPKMLVSIGFSVLSGTITMCQLTI